MIQDHQIMTLRDRIADSFKAGTAAFPHYTLHGLEHLVELDSLALSIGKAIGLKEDRLNLLRAALMIHDYAMVHLPDGRRMEILKERCEAGVALSEVIRQTHQDEIEQLFSKDEMKAQLIGIIGGGRPLFEAIKIAKHHRHHDLLKAPEDLRELCALGRIIDELDIGDGRAPEQAYQALRRKMDDTAKFHWLKHICTVPISVSGFLEEKKRTPTAEG